VTFERWQATVVDTGGFEPATTDDLMSAMRAQIMLAIEEADLIVFTVDGREGLTPVDTEIGGILRRSGRPVVVAVNKVDGAVQEAALGDVYRLGFKTVMPVSAEHGRGVAEMLEAVRDAAPVPVTEPGIDGVRVAIVGRPNVGKSSLVNAVLGQPRVLVHSAPGTTRDSVDTPLIYRGHPYVLIDTAGIRRKGKVSEALEKLSVVMALKSLERCQVAVLVLDATEGVTAQDAHIAGYAHDAGRALVIAVNKWDLVPPGMVSRGDVTGQIHDRLPFLDYAPICFISALRSAGLPELFDTVNRVAAEAQRRVAPGDLLALFREALDRRPMSAHGVPLRIQAALQVAVSPPTFALRVNLPENIHFSYERYLINSLRHAHPFAGSPIRLLFRKSGKSAARPGPRRSLGGSRR